MIEHYLFHGERHAYSVLLHQHPPPPVSVWARVAFEFDATAYMHNWVEAFVGWKMRKSEISVAPRLEIIVGWFLHQLARAQKHVQVLLDCLKNRILFTDCSKIRDKVQIIAGLMPFSTQLGVPLALRSYTSPVPFWILPRVLRKMSPKDGVNLHCFLVTNRTLWLSFIFVFYRPDWCSCKQKNKSCAVNGFPALFQDAPCLMCMWDRVHNCSALISAECRDYSDQQAAPKISHFTLFACTLLKML